MKPVIAVVLVLLLLLALGFLVWNAVDMVKSIRAKKKAKAEKEKADTSNQGKEV